METSKALSADQLEKLKATVRQRFDDLYHRIGTNRQKLSGTVLLADQAINKELNKEKIDATAEKKILGKIRDIEKVANNQLPHVPKVAVAPKPAAETKPTPAPKTPAKAPAKTPAKSAAPKAAAKTKKK